MSDPLRRASSLDEAGPPIGLIRANPWPSASSVFYFSDRRLARRQLWIMPQDGLIRWPSRGLKVAGLGVWHSIWVNLRHLRIHSADCNSSGGRVVGFCMRSFSATLGQPILNERGNLRLTLRALYVLFVSDMSPHPATAFADSASSDPAPDQPEACPHCALGRRVEQRLAMLQKLAELGMAAATAAKQRIVEQAERERGAAPDPTGARDQIAKNFQLDFSRAAQAVRQTLALQEKIEQDHLARIDRAAAEAAARRAEAARRRAAERQANIQRRKAQIHQELERVIRAKCEPKNLHSLIDNLRARLRPERLDSDFGDVPLSEIFLRICRNLGVPEEWSRQWDEEPEPEDTKHAEAHTPSHAVESTKSAEPAKTGEPGKAKLSPQRRQNTPPPPWAVPGNPPAPAAATALALCLAAPGTGPP